MNPTSSPPASLPIREKKLQGWYFEWRNHKLSYLSDKPPKLFTGIDPKDTCVALSEESAPAKLENRVGALLSLIIGMCFHYSI
ncbi:hypothetical protein GCM10007049_18680 [Echinicola pacifica]|uniref:Uncharacterized protein n=1 Tax=Echinicola pacifica TaxID=346377 RepID=A0A918PZZ1_9BACT|nr:hypothetical protein GCM10007049_18680 [Echinicola pacifica]